MGDGGGVGIQIGTRGMEEGEGVEEKNRRGMSVSRRLRLMVCW